MNEPITIGGGNYRWKGRAIRTIWKNNTTCVTMPTKDSMVMAPCQVDELTQYKITISGARISGNGLVYVNFFGDINHDGKSIPIVFNSSEFCDYSFSLDVPEYQYCAMNIRVWRSSKCSGNVYIKNIQINEIGYIGPQKLPSTPLPLKIKEPIKSENINIPIKLPKALIDRKSTKKDKPNKKEPQRVNRFRVTKRQETKLPRPKENDTMKFRPYEQGRMINDAFNALIPNVDSVPKVSIITLTRDGKELLEKCHNAISANTSYPNWEWIIGDSASTDGSVELIKSWNDPHTKLIERGTTEGSFSSINNEMVKYATGDYLLFLNNDTQPKPFWLYELVAKIHRNPEIGIVGSKLLYSDGSIQCCGIGFMPEGPGNIGKSMLKHFAPNFVDYDRYYQAVTGACFIMRRSDFDAVDGFDPIYYFCYEDIDLCLKVLYNLKKKILYAANSEVYHIESVTQNKFKTSGDLQKAGIAEFKKRWMSKVDLDFGKYQKNSGHNRQKTDISFVTCINDLQTYNRFIVASLFNSDSSKNYEVIPILNFGNPYSAAQALNIGLDKTRGDVIVFCHQDVIFYKNWIDLLYKRISEIETKDKHWGVLGTAGITKESDTIGIVHDAKGKIQWETTIRATVHQVQTIDEHCMVIRKNSGLRFDSNTFSGFHMYGADICLAALNKGMKNYGILCPLVHDSGSSLITGRQEFMKYLNALSNKWSGKFKTIRTPTSIINNGRVQTFIKFKD